MPIIRRLKKISVKGLSEGLLDGLNPMNGCGNRWIR